MKISSCRSAGLAVAALALNACSGGGGSSGAMTDSNASAGATNKAPTISQLASSAAIEQDASSDVIAFTVADEETAANALKVTVASSNVELLPNDGIQLMGNGASRSLLLTPSSGVAGTSTLTVTATDASGMSAQQTMAVTVTSVERSFTEMVGTAYAKQDDADAEATTGFSWVDNPENDETAFDYVFAD